MPWMCSIQYGESLCTLTTCGDWALVLRGLEAALLIYLDLVMLYAAYGLLRISLPHTPLNKGKEKGRGTPERVQSGAERVRRMRLSVIRL
jgi:hypothetical protein